MSNLDVKYSVVKFLDVKYLDVKYLDVKYLDVKVKFLEVIYYSAQNTSVLRAKRTFVRNIRQDTVQNHNK